VIRCKERLTNCPEAVLGQATINLDSLVWKSLLGDSLPKLYCVDLAEAYVTQEGASLRILIEKRYDFALAKWTFAPETFGGRRKEERRPVLSLLPGFLERLALRNSRILCQKHEGTCTMYYLKVPKVQENGTRNWIPVQPRKAQRNCRRCHQCHHHH
jgi:hypothetical protein